MNKTNSIRDYVLLALLLMLPFATAAAQTVQVEQEIDSVQILIGQQAHVTYRINAPHDADVQMPLFQPGQMITPGVEVVGISEADTTDLPDGAMQVSRVYTLTSFDDTLYYVPPQTFTVNGKQYKSKSLALKVLDMDVDMEHPDQFFGLKDVQDNPFSWADYLPAFIAYLVMLLVVLLVTLSSYLMRYNKPLLQLLRKTKRVPAHEEAMSQIDELKQDKHTSVDNPKLYYTRLTEVLRHYMERRFGFSAMEMTTGEIIEHLNQNADEQSIKELRQLFETADLVKFARHQTMLGENDMNLVNAVDFIQSTKREEEVVEEVKPAISAEERSKGLRRKWLRVVQWIAGVLGVAAYAYIIYYIIDFIL